MDLRDSFTGIFDALMRDALTEGGRWWQQQGDASGWGPFLLFSLAEDDLGLSLGSAPRALAEAGMAVAERCRRLAPLFPFMPRLWVDTLMGVLGMYRADSYLRDGHFRSAIERVLLEADGLLLAAGKYPEKARLGPFGPTVSAGLLAILNLLYGRFYYTRPLLPPVDFPGFGLEILKATEDRALHPDGYFLDSPQEDGLLNLPNLVVSIACVLAWERSGDDSRLELARSALQALESLRDHDRGGYFSRYPGAPGGDFKELSFHAYHLLALLFLASADPEGGYLDTARGLAEFVVRDFNRGGRLRHHWHRGRASNAYCAGCNLHFLYCLYLMFNLEDNGILIDEVIETDAKSPLIAGVRHPFLSPLAFMAAAGVCRRLGSGPTRRSAARTPGRPRRDGVRPEGDPRKNANPVPGARCKTRRARRASVGLMTGG